MPTVLRVKEIYVLQTFPEFIWFIEKTKEWGLNLQPFAMTGMGKEVEDLASPKQYILRKRGKNALVC